MKKKKKTPEEKVRYHTLESKSELAPWEAIGHDGIPNNNAIL